MSKSDDARALAYERRMADRIRSDVRNRARDAKRSERVAFGGAR